ncbi:hypothetical protein B14911_27570 [Bacillus sp. NRRL B-14911]|uniref:Uncharacterized protein n=1 Tax=Bacillus infantis NRRL B-14911 TaxID=1367477 RepID=U5LCW3_9BACI|nr:hypothetical protein N288_12735 [Bacillus infantis NRRL B-14911]EAR66839.1 hypothetical protein B14911_27570 [Bacillus sp. NRRL B-14911]OXT14815.1 hypothetical protein B9K06_24350 [Bacillus sp. OG2]PLR74591.1 hypothetical protein CYJ37_02885 [Bacillus sp. UMB0728]
MNIIIICLLYDKGLLLNSQIFAMGIMLIQPDFFPSPVKFCWTFMLPVNIIIFKSLADINSYTKALKRKSKTDPFFPESFGR